MRRGDFLVLDVCIDQVRHPHCFVDQLQQDVRFKRFAQIVRGSCVVGPADDVAGLVGRDIHDRHVLVRRDLSQLVDNPKFLLAIDRSIADDQVNRQLAGCFDGGVSILGTVHVVSVIVQQRGCRRKVETTGIDNQDYGVGQLGHGLPLSSTC